MNIFLKIFGIVSLMAYTFTLMSIWIISDVFNNTTYFLVGEHVAWIKYFEWAFGSIGLIIGCITIKQSINDYNNDA